MKHFVLGLLLFLLLVPNSFSQEIKRNDEYTFMFYNVENLFDCENDSLTQDDEFTPDGDRRWNFNRFHEKADRLAKVILAAGKWNPPVFVGLCEVEGLQALEVLTKQTPLRNSNYKIIHKDSPDERGIDVALIYRPEIFVPYDYQAILVSDPLNPEFKTRDILLVSGILNNCDTLHIFVNHWPSRYGGLMETIRYRKLAAGILKNEIHKFFDKYTKANVICMGDFNDTPEDESLSVVLNAVKTNNSELKGEMVNLSSEWMSRSLQTLKNLYSWQVFDQFIVSDYLIENSNCIKFQTAEIFDAAFLLEPDKKYGGVKPKRTYVGFKFQEGFSDHLPILFRYKLVNY